ncbi:MAG: dihydroxyacetone kinase subunit L [Synergistaceae bacterium]|nr:dihydroxyacetone kinase subunit L [Synergistaceae bacterium]
MAVYECLTEISNKIIANKDFLTELDREIGDSDHGINLSRGFTAVLEKVSKDEQDMGVSLKKAGMTLLSTVGGASGPLYGTAFMEAAKVLTGKTELNAQDFLAALDAAIAGIQKRGKAVKGEKTMLDAIIPARDAYAEKLNAGADLIAGLEAAVKAANDGVEYTKTIIATKGRASYLGERSIGHQDPGATSSTLTLEAILDYLKNK